MNRAKNIISLVVLSVSVLAGLAVSAEAQKRNERDIRDSVRNINSKIDDFETDLRYQMQSTSSPNTQVNAVTDDIRNLTDAVRQFEDNYDRRRENRDDVNNIVEKARRIEAFMSANRQNRRVEDDWTAVKKQIDRLSANYGVVNNWNVDSDPPQYPVDQNYPVQQQPGGTLSVGLSGTYELDSARSENIDDIVADTKLGNDQRQDLKDKLTAPQQVALDIRGQQVTLATSNAAPITFVADGRDKTDRSASGKTIRVRATIYGDTLTISSLGGDTDYTIKFVSTSNGRVMKVSRRITTDYLSQTVFAESVYNKTDSVAQIGGNGVGTSSQSTNGSTDPNGTYSDNDQNNGVSNGGGYSGGAPTTSNPRPGNYTIPNGTVVTGILENEINTKISQNNDRFRLTVQSPVDLRGAVIEGYISGVGRSGKVTGQSNVTFNFERITLRNGQVYDFAGTVQSIKDAYGKEVKVDNEGTAKGDNQTNQTAKRGGIGAGAGAILGAIIGGGKGAAIGAVIGAGGGAGTVAAQGRSDVQLQKGSTMTIQASAPSQNYNR